MNSYERQDLCCVWDIKNVFIETLIKSLLVNMDIQNNVKYIKQENEIYKRKIMQERKQMLMSIFSNIYFYILYI